ncbi:HAD-like domain-containing protein [Mycena latifolia]|nr:HAD-like domain-containing protein [Mycena latifolia]
MPCPRPSLRALLIDISGTLHVGSVSTPSAVDAFRRLRASGVPYRLCSNTSKESTRDVSARLRGLGLDIADDLKPAGAGFSSEGGPREVWTSIGAVRRVMQDMDRPYLLLSDSARQELQLDHDSELADDSEDDESTPFDAVVVGLCPARLDYAHLNTAFRIPRARAPRPPRLRARAGGLALGPGPFVAALEHAASVTAHVVGKPTRAFFSAVIADLDAHKGSNNDISGSGRIAIIGDDVDADLGGGAVELGLWRVLVRTGKYRPGDEHRAASAAGRGRRLVRGIRG